MSERVCIGCSRLEGQKVKEEPELNTQLLLSLSGHQHHLRGDPGEMMVRFNRVFPAGNDRGESPADPRSDHWITHPAVSESSGGPTSLVPPRLC